MERILIVEDDAAMVRGLKDNFVYAGYEVSTATEGESGLRAILNGKPDLVLLDIMLPGMNGYEICRRVRQEKLEMPIIMLTAKGEESDIILGLNLGADDYVTKPFGIKELMARVGAFLRRKKQGEKSVFEFGDFVLDVGARTLRQGDKEVKLSPKEFKLLEMFLKKEGRALTRDDILNYVWGYNSFAGHRSVDRCVTTLRNKIEVEPHQPQFIQTLRDVGYKFIVNSE